jgi:hypothetical protein
MFAEGLCNKDIKQLHSRNVAQYDGHIGIQDGSHQERSGAFQVGILIVTSLFGRL